MVQSKYLISKNKECLSFLVSSIQDKTFGTMSVDGIIEVRQINLQQVEQ
jgi:hypothetical protein